MRPLIAIAILTLSSTVAEAADIEASAEVTSVTLYPNSAGIERNGSVVLDEGTHHVILNDLPSSLIDNTLRASSSAELISVDVIRTFSEQETSSAERELVAQINTLEHERRGLANDHQVQIGQLDLIRELGSAFAERIAGAEGDVPLSPTTWNDVRKSLGDGEMEIRARLLSIERESKALEQRIETLQNELDQIRTGSKESKQVILRLDVRDAGETSFSVGYQTDGAGWTAFYEARLDSEGETVTLKRLASIRQQTGENWNDVVMELATSLPSAGTTPPQASSWDVDVAPELAPRSVMMESLAYGDKSIQADAAPLPSTQAEVIGSTLQTRFRLTRPVSLAADGRVRRQLISLDEHPVEIQIVAIPMLDPAAYLTASMTIDGEAPLVQGPVEMFVDGSFVGKGYVEDLAAGSPLTLAFGEDRQVAFERRMETGGRSSSGIINKSRVTERTFLIEITNRHDQDMPVAIKELIPVSRDERIEIELNDQTTSPDQQNADGVEGLLAWRWIMKAGETRLIRVGYTISHPVDLPVSGIDRF